MQKLCARRQVRRPWKRVAVEKRFFMKPWIAAENFIRTFTGQYDFVLFCHFAAEVEQGRVHICHTGKVMCVYGFIQFIRLYLAAALQIVVIGMQKCRHLIDVRAVHRRLKAVCLKIFVIVGKVKGVSSQCFPLRFQFFGTDGRDETGVYAAG